MRSGSEPSQGFIRQPPFRAICGAVAVYASPRTTVIAQPEAQVIQIRAMRIKVLAAHWLGGLSTIRAGWWYDFPLFLFHDFPLSEKQSPHVRALFVVGVDNGITLPVSRFRPVVVP